jgi:hypothetical protein
LGRTGNDRGDPVPRDGRGPPSGPARRGGSWRLVATHDPDALQFADRILALEDGRLAEVTA